MTDWTTKVWGIDASDAVTCNFSNALKNGLGFAIHKIGQGINAIDLQWPNFVQQAYDQKVPVIGGYYVVDPVYYIEKLQGIDKLRALDHWLPAALDEQYQKLVSGVKNKAIQVLALDVEIFKDYRGNIIDPTWCSEAAFQFMVRVKKNIASINPKIKQVIIYTGKWYIDAYAPNMKNWMAGLDDPWVAQYTKTGYVTLTDWGQLRSHYPPAQINGHDNPDYLYAKNWKIWQWWGDGVANADFLGPTGKPCSLDINFFNGSMADLCAWAGVSEPITTPTEPTPVEPEPTEPEPEIPGEQVENPEFMALITKMADDLAAIRAHFK